jgi:1-deoxy-D-xylulose-5-phosphate reductoisomerase
LIESTCDRFSAQNTLTPTLEDILEADAWGRRTVIELASREAAQAWQ